MDKMRLKELAIRLECSESYVMRKAIKILYDNEIKRGIDEQNQLFANNTDNHL